MKFHHLITGLLTILLLACKSDALDIQNDEYIKIKTTSMGCFNFETFRTEITKHNDSYYVSICKIHTAEPSARSLHKTVQEGIMTEIWEKPKYDNFIEQIKKENDTTSFSTSNVFHEIEINGTPQKKYKSHSNVIIRYIK
jgi:hypothetical protein